MKKLQLDSEYSAAIQKTDGLQKHFLRFPGKSQNDMDDYRNIRFMKSFHRFGKTGKGISSADKQSRFFVDRLKSQLNPDEFIRKILFQGSKQTHNLCSETIGPGSNGNTGNIRFHKSLAVNGGQIIHRAVGISIGLKIRDIAAACFFLFQKFFSGFQLFPDGKRAIHRLSSGQSPCGKFPASARAAEDTASAVQSTISVGAGKARV